MLSWVSKWLRERSSVPANGTKASWRRSNSGPSVSLTAGASAQLSSSASAPVPAPVTGRGIAMVGRAS
jgi:hypothetical protein